MPTSIKEIKPVPLVKYEFENGEKNQNISIFLKNSDFQDTDVIEKINEFLDGYSPTSAVFSVELLMDETELVVAEIKEFEYRAKSN